MEILLALALGGYLGWTWNEPDKFDCKDDALVIAACPDLVKLTDPSFGGHILQLQLDSGQYRECQKACLKP